jgi:hypothetical protein
MVRTVSPEALILAGAFALVAAIVATTHVRTFLQGALRSNGQ